MGMVRDSENNDSEQGEKTLHFVLVHGASHGGWCWYKIVHLLRSSGHLVTVVDLLGCGLSPVDPNTITSFDSYDKPLMDALSQIPLSHKIVVVGHSAGGLSLTHALHEFSHRISVAVYLCATMLPRGFQTVEDVKLGAPDLNDVSKSFYCHEHEDVPTSSIICSEFQQEVLYQLSPPEDASLASLLLRPAPVLALCRAKFESNSAEEFTKVPRVYIKTLQDRIVKLEQQEAMINMWPPSKVMALDTDHSPFFSSPLQLFSCLVAIATDLDLDLHITTSQMSHEMSSDI